ncbi:hypothetical protein B0T25DRAFT_552116 [Lasiosphaeria hispida]|uniref:Ig-like domain-containing protein n=1 Tax=Lasiosphaeria hispida TaxID=260671 RepID=A0AAJ0HC43_9PEZI|nr:hypothetical protein B0T25DRAFT_552116 [Lasiosphaeria hispida]
MAGPGLDPEPGEYRPKHYHVLAQVMARETNLAIFRRFEELNYLRLMRLQAEIMEAKVAFEDRCTKDHMENPTFSMSFRELNLSRKPPVRLLHSDGQLDSGSGSGLRSQCHCQIQDQNDEPPSQSNVWQMSQLELLGHIDRRLSEYNQLLIELSQVRSIRKPEKSQLKALKNWLIRDDGGKGFLNGSEMLVWAESDVGEYACLATGTETDVFTALIRRIIVMVFPWFLRGRKAKAIIEQSSGLRRYDDDRVNAASNIISLVISSVLPILAIFVLNSRQSTTERFGFTVLFTALFALALGFFSSAKRAEIFAATATFAAVEVVFIGTALGAGNAPPLTPPAA